MLVAVCALTGAAPFVTVTPANATPPGTTAIPTVFDLNGAYVVGLPGRPVITNVNDILTVNMSALGRPTATGVVVNSDTIIVTFPDDATYGGKLLAARVIRWSNRSDWYKALPMINMAEVSDPTTGKALLSTGL